MTRDGRDRLDDRGHDRVSPAGLWIVIPAFNEAPVIGDVVAAMRSEYDNVVVIDDGSDDETATVAGTAGASVVRHPINLGQGAALRTGFDFALAKGAQTLVTFDGDGQHDIADIAGLVSTLHETGSDIALGSRFLEPGQELPAGRRLLLKAAVLFTRMVSGIQLTDAHNGMRALRAESARVLDIRQPRMAHASEIVHGIVKHRLRHVEVPVDITYSARSRRKGQATLDSLNIVFDLAVQRLLR